MSMPNGLLLCLMDLRGKVPPQYVTMVLVNIIGANYLKA